MKLRRIRLSLMVVMLLLSAQPSPASPAARNTVTSTTAAPQHGDHQVGIPDSRCRRRCSSTYRQCLRRGKNRRACARQLRSCQRRCPQ